MCDPEYNKVSGPVIFLLSNGKISTGSSRFLFMEGMTIFLQMSFLIYSLKENNNSVYILCGHTQLLEGICT